MITISDKKYNVGKNIISMNMGTSLVFLLGRGIDKIVFPQPNNLGFVLVLSTYFSIAIQKHCIRQLWQKKYFQAVSSLCANLR